MRVAAGSDWVMDIGPGAGEEGGQVVAFGTPVEVAGSSISRWIKGFDDRVFCRVKMFVACRFGD